MAGARTSGGTGAGVGVGIHDRGVRTGLEQYPLHPGPSTDRQGDASASVVESFDGLGSGGRSHPVRIRSEIQHQAPLRFVGLEHRGFRDVDRNLEVGRGRDGAADPIDAKHALVCGPVTIPGHIPVPLCGVDPVGVDQAL